MSRFQAVDFHAPSSLIEQDGRGRGSTYPASLPEIHVELDGNRPVRGFALLTGEQGVLARRFFSEVRYWQRRVLDLLQSDRSPPDFVDTQAMVQPVDAADQQAADLPPARS